ncbi:MAG TPA: pyridoxamine 5'-phosphate oxidase family protein [Paucimonas sp.]|nr:pyridoxamine 5'-phosphate oxidase family protein [Paucimonas sp.]HJW53856.1 pyridoxamine 5'-phosphate oxidase family protein [Burkholderiaceae bacterium]
MPRRFAQLTFTDSVKAAQAHYGTRSHNERYEASEMANAALGTRESEFIAARDSFYLATVSETGWPYVQHRGGDPGFLKVLDAKTLAFADFRGNRQYQSVGNLGSNDRVCLIFVDYPQRRRLKLLGHARIIDLAEVGERMPALLGQLHFADAGAKVERVLLIAVEAFDWNCAQHITPRFSEREMNAMITPLRQRIAILEARLRQLGCEPP